MTAQVAEGDGKSSTQSTPEPKTNSNPFLSEHPPSTALVVDGCSSKLSGGQIASQLSCQAAGQDWLHIPAIFINLFAGDSAPLSRVAVELGLLQLQPPHVSAAIDALDDTVFPTLEQICAVGVVGVLWCAPPPSADLQSRSRACRLIYLAVSWGGVAIFEQASASWPGWTLWWRRWSTRRRLIWSSLINASGCLASRSMCAASDDFCIQPPFAYSHCGGVCSPLPVGRGGRPGKSA